MTKPNKKEKAIKEEIKEEIKENSLEDSPNEPVDTPDALSPEQKEIETLKEQKKELEDKVLRQMAEFDNFRKRTTKEKEEIGIVVKMKCVSELLPVIDSFERALKTECADVDFKKGVEMIFTSFQDALKKMGVEEIEAEGKDFDPEIHYAVSRVEDENLGENVVANVLQKGYKIGEKVIRHSMVAVANP
ncbi:MAG: nucleotide exchange factor GrpE [Oscillospiraceae bacterium]